MIAYLQHKMLSQKRQDADDSNKTDVLLTQVFDSTGVAEADHTFTQMLPYLHFYNEVGVDIDDGDVVINNCVLTSFRFGCVLRDGCDKCQISRCVIENNKEIGLMCAGTSGVATITKNVIRRCGQFTLLLSGPSP